MVEAALRDADRDFHTKKGSMKRNIRNGILKSGKDHEYGDRKRWIVNSIGKKTRFHKAVVENCKTAGFLRGAEVFTEATVIPLEAGGSNQGMHQDNPPYNPKYARTPSTLPQPNPPP